MNFHQLQIRLLDVARRRVRNGTVTERGLARLSGLSQPHIHNSLKAIRVLSLESSDLLMAALHLGIGDLLGAPTGQFSDADFSYHPIPFLRARIGPGSQPVFDSYRGYFPVISSMTGNLDRPLAAELAPDLVLPRTCAAGDTVLLDQNPTLRAHPVSGTWVVSEGVFGMRVRYVRLDKSRLYIFHEANAEKPEKWESISLNGRNILDVVRARVVWVGRTLE